MNQLDYINNVFDLISETICRPKEKGICPECGSNRIRKLFLFRACPYYDYRNKDEIEDYGAYQCECGYCFHIEPERIHFGEPKGIKII